MLVVLPRACLLRAFVVRVSRCVFVRAAFDICCPAPCAVALILMLLLCVFRVAVRCAFFVRLGAFCLCVLLPLRVSRRTAAVLTCLLLLIIVIAGAMLAALMCCSVLWQLLSPVCRVLDCGLLARALLLFLLRVCPGGRACGIILFNALLRPAQLLVPCNIFFLVFWRAVPVCPSTGLFTGFRETPDHAGLAAYHIRRWSPRRPWAYRPAPSPLSFLVGV